LLPPKPAELVLSRRCNRTLHNLRPRVMSLTG
jgi:hypothetical protein